MAEIKSAARRRAQRSKLGPTAVKRAIIYLRMSMDRNGEGAGIDRQETACRALCVARGWDVVAVHDDTMSATDYRLNEREGWRRVRAMVEAGEADVIVAFHLDRVTRDMKDLEALIELAVDKGVGLSTATGDIDLTTDAGRMVARILAAVAKAEGERKAERMILANDQRVAQGRPQWIRRPFGFEMDGSHRESEAVAIKQAYHDLLSGKALKAVVREWNEAGLSTTAPEPGGHRATPDGNRKNPYRPSGQWTSTSLREFLMHPRNAGIITQYHGFEDGMEAGKGQWEPIVDEPTFRAVQLMFESRKRPNGSRSMLSGVALCHRCAEPVRGSKSNGKAVYRCTSGHVGIDRELADDIVRDRVLMAVARAGRRSLYDIEPAEVVDVAPLLKRAEQIDQMMAQFVMDATQGLIDRAAMLAGTEGLRAERTELRAKLAAAGAAADAAPVKKKTAWSAAEAFQDQADLLDLLRHEWGDAELHERRAFIGQWLDLVEFAPGIRGKHTSTYSPIEQQQRVVTVERESRLRRGGMSG